MSDATAVLWLIDLVIVVALVEGALLVLLHRLGRRGLPGAEVVPNLLAGLCLVAAVRAVVAGADTAWALAWLAAAGVAHGVDVLQRWRRTHGLRPGTH